MPAAQKMTDVSLSIFRSKFKKTRIQMIDYTFEYVSLFDVYVSHKLLKGIDRPVHSNNQRGDDQYVKGRLSVRVVVH